MPPRSSPPGSPPSNAPPAERRRDARAPIELKVEYKRLNSFFADYTRNISKDGTFIATTRPLPIGTAFVFKLTIPKLDEPLQLSGKVAWTVSEEQASSDQPAGMGIQFAYRSESERATVHGVVHKLMEDSLGKFLSDQLLTDASGAPDPTVPPPGSSKS